MGKQRIKKDPESAWTLCLPDISNRETSKKSNCNSFFRLSEYPFKSLLLNFWFKHCHFRSLSISIWYFYQKKGEELQLSYCFLNLSLMSNSLHLYTALSKSAKGHKTKSTSTPHRQLQCNFCTRGHTFIMSMWIKINSWWAYTCKSNIWNKLMLTLSVKIEDYL